MKQYDYIILGSGPGGSSAALGLAKEGNKVAVIDSLFGGTCALKGCTPKKAMESVTSAYWAAKDFSGKGFPGMNGFVDWHLLMSHKSKFTTLVPSGTKEKFTNAGIDIYETKGSFIDNQTILAGEETLEGNRIIIATGAKPFQLPIEGVEYIKSSYDFFELDSLPKDIVIIGGGYIAFELSHIAAACGSNVTIISRAEIPFPSFDSDIVKGLVKSTLHKGVDVRLGYEAVSVEKQSGRFQVNTKRNGSEEFSFEADLVINAAGRVPNTDSLNLDKTDLTIFDNGGIKIDDFLVAEGAENIFAIGDVTGMKPFTEAANYEADILLYNFKHKRRKKVDYHGLPVVVYTYPKMAMVGKCAQELDKENQDYEIAEARLSSFFTQRVKANEFAGYKTCIDPKSGSILGAHLLGCEVEEIINLFGMAMQMDVKADDLKNLLLAYPTATHDIKFLFK